MSGATAKNTIDGKGRTVSEILSRKKYSIDYYQREYRWGNKQLVELVEDLTGKFLESHEPDNDRTAVAQYGHIAFAQSSSETRNARSSSSGSCIKQRENPLVDRLVDLSS
jgi:uncharacterized protein with ParB-like and HNH nuclease domain